MGRERCIAAREEGAPAKKRTDSPVIRFELVQEFSGYRLLFPRE
jgi:hypothetical protein